MPVSLIEIYYTLFVILGGVVLGISITFGICEYIAWRYPEWVVWTPNGEEIVRLREDLAATEYLWKMQSMLHHGARTQLENIKPDAAPWTARLNC